MLNLLVVDDDKFEREGVRYLIEKFGFDLAVAEADSGESALAHIARHPVDIMLSDIRMTGMDGLQLAEQVREMKPDRPVKIIFMSAYGEFEYAQRAIDVQAIRYLLKPIQVTEFLKIISLAIQQCEEERLEMAQLERMEQAYMRETRFEKQKLLADLILGRTETADEPDSSPLPIEGFGDSRAIRMLMLDAHGRFFDRTSPDFEAELAAAAGRLCELVHLNEFQALLLVPSSPDEPSEALVSLGRALSRRFKAEYGQDIAVVVSGLIEDARQLYREYRAMETLLESKFYWEEGAVVQANRALEADDGDVTAAVHEVLEEIRQHIHRSRLDVARLRFEQLFDTLQSSSRLSPVYVKYVCMEIAKAVFDASVRKNAESFNKELERIHRTERLADLRLVMREILDDPSLSGDAFGEGVSKAVGEAVRMIEREYANDLSLELLAERVYLSPSYLSYLFKKQQGVSINKFITQYRMNKAKEQLLTTNRKVVDIAPSVGYANIPYFISLFKSHFGKTPAQFREEA